MQIQQFTQMLENDARNLASLNFSTRPAHKLARSDERADEPGAQPRFYNVNNLQSNFRRCFRSTGPTSRTAIAERCADALAGVGEHVPAHHGRAEARRVRDRRRQAQLSPGRGNRRARSAPAGDAGDQPAAGAPVQTVGGNQTAAVAGGRAQGTEPCARSRTRRPGGPSGTFLGNGVSYYACTRVQAFRGTSPMTKHVVLALLVSLSSGVSLHRPNGNQLIADPRALKAEFDRCEKSGLASED